MPDKIMKDGKPSTSFSRQDREWVKAMVGGSGSSDFSTAEVTIVGEYGHYLTTIVEDSGSESVMTAMQTYTGTVKVPLYKGHYLLTLQVPYFSAVTVTGNAEVIMEGMGLHITGDCTITVPGNG